eukprot:Gb_34250 [translate_table: standard]
METLTVAGVGSPTGFGMMNYDYDSACSTPYVSAPSSPGRPGGFLFLSAPASPNRIWDPNPKQKGLSTMDNDDRDDAASVSTGSDFEFSARFSELEGASVSTQPTMSSADELFCNGQIRPMKLSTHLQKPQSLRPLIDFDDETKGRTSSNDGICEEGGKDGFEKEERGRERVWRDNSRHQRRTRSLSPLRTSSSQWEEAEPHKLEGEEEKECAKNGSAASSKSRGSKRWSLKDFLYRSTSEGRGHTRERLWSLPFSPAKPSDKEKQQPSSSKKSDAAKHSKPAEKHSHANTAKKTNNNNNNVAGSAAPRHGRRVPLSPHELHYTANRAQAEELKRKTFLPYRQGLLGCLGFSSKSYTTMNGFARTLHPLS